MKRVYITTALTCLLILVGVMGVLKLMNLSGYKDHLTVGFIYDNDESTPYTYNFSLAKDAVEKEYGGRVKQSQKRLSDVGNGLLWLFYDKEERKSVKDAFHTLSDLMEGDYAQRINQVTSNTEGKEYNDLEA